MPSDSSVLARPLLIDSDTALDRYLETYPQVPFVDSEAGAGIDLPGWQAQGDDAVEQSWRTAQTLGVPLVRLSRLQPDPAAVALIGPELARQLRAVPLRGHGGMIAVAMEDPGTRQTQSVLDFISRLHVIPLIGSPREIRDGIARCYDRVEDRNVARQLGIDPESLADDTNPAEAQRLAKEQPVVRIVHTLIADAVTRRA